MRLACTTLWVILALGLSGCTTLLEEHRAAGMRERAQVDSLETGVGSLQARVEGLEAALQELYRQAEQSRSQSINHGTALNEKVIELSRALKAMEADRERDKQEVIDSLSRRVAEIMRTQAASAPRTERGYEYVVKPGETLSQIAAAYKTSVSAIVKANNLSSADSLRAGQKLFIPE